MSTVTKGQLIKYEENFNFAEKLDNLVVHDIRLNIYGQYAVTITCGEYKKKLFVLYL